MKFQQALRQIAWIILLSALAMPAQPQDSNYGFSLPVTLSGGAMYTGRLQFQDPGDSPVRGGFRAMLYPTLRLGTHWFAYAAEQVRYTPYFYYDAYDPDHEWYTETLQAFVGYQIRHEKTSMVIKAGRLSSAFGAFPLHYDDADNALLDQPLSYIQTLAFRNDQIPCGVQDLLRQHYGFVANQCGGPPGGGLGLTPVSLYGLPGIQAEVSSHRVDARVQITSGSPANPLSLSHAPDYAQWVAGGGYTIRQGFRVGISGFRGPYLAPELTTLLPAGTTVRDFPASGLGLEAQWASGHWSASGEWQRFQFDSPNLTQAPSVISTYVEAKRILTPRLYVAGRTGWLKPGGATDTSAASTSQFSPSMASYELGAGCWINRHQLLKGSYEWLRIQNLPGTRTNVLGFQFVTTFHALDQAFH
jgi:hypothetical protein